MNFRSTFKYFLALLALALAAVLLFWQREDGLGVVLNAPIETTIDNTTISADKAKVSSSGVTVEGAKFSGQDLSGRRWQLLANKAEQGEPTEPIALDYVNAVISQPNKPDMRFKALTGSYDPAQSVVTLTGQVVLSMQQATLTTPSLNANLSNLNADAHEAVTVTTPRGTMSGHKLEVRQNGQQLHMVGPVNAVFNVSK